MPEALTFKQGDTWPPKDIQARNQRYAKFRKIYNLEQADLWRTELGINPAWRFIPSELPIVIVETIRDWMFQRPLKIEFPEGTDKTTEEAVNRIVEEVDLLSVCREMKEHGGITGDMYPRVGFNEDFPGEKTEFGVIADWVMPELIVPKFLPQNNRIAESLSIAWVVLENEGDPSSAKFLIVETYLPGEIRAAKYKLDASNQVSETVPLGPDDPDEFVSTGTEVPLIQHIKNRGSAGFYGESDICRIENQVKQICNRQTIREWALDRMGKPILVFPESALLKREDKETGNVFYEVPSELITVQDKTESDTIKYLTWDQNIEGVQKSIQDFVEAAYASASVAKAAVGIDIDSGLVDSGRAMKLALSRMLTLIDSAKRPIQTSMARILFAAQELEVNMGKVKYKPVLPKLTVETGIPDDREITAKIIQSVAPHLDKESIFRLWYPDDSEAKLKERMAAMQSANAPTPAGSRLETRRQARLAAVEGVAA